MIFFQNDSKGKDKMKKGTKLRPLSSFARSNPLMVSFSLFFHFSCNINLNCSHMFISIVAQISKCGICQDTLVNPKSLPFAVVCALLCSACHLVDFDPSRVFFVDSMVSQGQIVSDPNNVKCQLCEEGELAVTHCPECPSFLCRQCAGFHGRAPILTSQSPLMRPSLARNPQPKGFLGAPSIL